MVKHMNIQQIKFQNILSKDIFNRPVFAVISAFIIIIYIMYNTGKIKEIPCGDTYLQHLFRSVVHIDLYHLIANLSMFYVLSSLEVELGSGIFLGLIVMLTLMTTLMDYFIPIGKCAIGFSAILLGLIVIKMYKENTIAFDMYSLVYILWIWVGPLLTSQRVSASGHAFGLISGVIIVSIYAIYSKIKN